MPPFLISEITVPFSVLSKTCMTNACIDAEISTTIAGI